VQWCSGAVVQWCSGAVVQWWWFILELQDANAAVARDPAAVE
jgi:hypothetical protein